nr:cold shock domain-containing protein [Micromonospora sp. HK10]
MTSVGSVRSFDPAEGWGVIDGADVPGGCWVHFSALAMEGYRTLTAGTSGTTGTRSWTACTTGTATGLARGASRC